MKTPATQFLDERGVTYSEHSYEYVEHGGAERGAEQLGVPAAEVVKTLVMQDEKAQPLIVLMHGDRKVSTKNLARQAGRKSIEPCRPEVAQRHSGYQVGGTSPFGTRKRLPVFMERSIADLASIYINGGRRGLLLKLSTKDLVNVLEPRLVDAALED
ncbi:MAG TPA: Cys-tRNA(Pro) deacylase [Burkholderiales bacterium]|nr:Cys-tRNA(Pro) deacylase [Burkholderiales bacterium]